MKKKIAYLSIAFVIILLNSIIILYSNDNTKNYDYEKGMQILTEDSSLLVKTEIVVQPRISSTLDISNNNKFHQESFIRRFRIRFGGFALVPSLTYYFHIGISNIDMNTARDPEADKPGIIYDAYIEWNFADGLFIQFGQSKLPGGISRMMSFSSLNFLERSYCESVFNLYRDVGIQLRHQWNSGDFSMREYIAFTNGEGINWTSTKGGYNYTMRAEILPFGPFKNKGEYSEMDMNYEDNIRSILGCALSYNDDAIRRNNTFGGLLFKNVDLTTIALDFINKYRGFTLFGEYYRRDQGFFPFENNYKKYAPDYITYNNDSTERTVVFAGWGFSGQISYTFAKDWAIAARYSYVKPVAELRKSEDERSDYTLGLSKFISKNKFKLQADFSYIEKIKSGNIKKGLEGRFNVLIIL